MITMKNVSLKISGMNHHILSEISYRVEEGDFIVVLGSNGSGKSSLLKLLDRRYAATSGNITLLDKPITQYPSKAHGQLVKTITQNYDDSLFLTLTVRENYHLHAQTYLSSKTLADYFSEFNPNLKNKLDVLASKLSGGEKQALVLALTLLSPPRILLLDEHTSALDPHSATSLMKITAEMTKQLNITCLLTTHDLEIASQYGNRLLALKGGKIYREVENEEKVAFDRERLLVDCY